MKVLAIIGSPKKKGNTYDVVQKIEERMKLEGNVEFEYLFLASADLKPCRGCYVCISKGKHQCPLKDGRPKIEEQLLRSDGVILASPVLTWNISGLMKNFLDRFAYASHQPRFFNQRLMLVMTMGGIGKRPAFNALSYFQKCGSPLVQKLCVITPPYPTLAREKGKDERKIDRAALGFYRAIETGEIPPINLQSIIEFRVFRKYLTFTRKFLPYDYEYWRERGWLDEKSYFTDSRLGPLKSLIGEAAEIVYGLYMKMRYSNLEREST